MKQEQEGLAVDVNAGLIGFSKAQGYTCEQENPPGNVES